MEFEKIKKIISEQFSINQNDITEGTSFADDLGVDSLDLLELVMALEQEFDIEIDDDDLKNIKTVGDAIKYIRENA